MFAQHEEIQHFIKEKNYGKALNMANQQITEGNNSGRIYYLKALCEHGMKLYSSSVSSSTEGMTKVNQSDSVYWQLLFQRGLSYALSGDFNLAIADNESLIKKFPENLSYLLNISYYYGQNRQYYNCIKALKKGLNLDSTHVTILNNLAYYNGEVKDYKSAIHYAKMGLKFAKDSIWVGSLLNNLGYSQGKEYSIEKGVETIIESLKYNPTNSYAYFNLALLHIDNNEMNIACENLFKAREHGGINMTRQYIEQYCEY